MWSKLAASSLIFLEIVARKTKSLSWMGIARWQGAGGRQGWLAHRLVHGSSVMMKAHSRVVGDRTGLPTAKNKPKPSQESSGHCGPCIHKLTKDSHQKVHSNLAKSIMNTWEPTHLENCPKREDLRCKSFFGRGEHLPRVFCTTQTLCCTGAAPFRTSARGFLLARSKKTCCTLLVETDGSYRPRKKKSLIRLKDVFFLRM